MLITLGQREYIPLAMSFLGIKAYQDYQQSFFLQVSVKPWLVASQYEGPTTYAPGSNPTHGMILFSSMFTYLFLLGSR